MQRTSVDTAWAFFLATCSWCREAGGWAKLTATQNRDTRRANCRHLKQLKPFLCQFSYLQCEVLHCFTYAHHSTEFGYPATDQLWLTFMPILSQNNNSPLLFSLCTNDCTSTDPFVKLLKFADDTSVIGLIRDGDESAYRQQVDQLVLWCSQNNLEPNTLKTVEILVDFRRDSPSLLPLTVLSSPVAIVESFRFLGTIISQVLKWKQNISSILKNTQQRMYFLRLLKKHGLP